MVSAHHNTTMTTKQKSGFPTDGRNHHAGIKNESDIAALWTTSPPPFFTSIYGTDIKFIHHGGTHAVSDIDIVDEDTIRDGISLKHHKSGTYDYINTSKVSDFLDDSEVKPKLASIRTSGLSVDDTRKQVTNCLASTLTGLTSSQIKSLLETCNLRSPRWMCINDLETGRLIVFEHSEIDAFRSREDDEFFLKSTPRARTSATIWRRREGVDTNTTLRLRLVLNNGIGAFLKLPTSKNKSSVPTLKIQQDNVKSLLSRVKSVVL